MGMKIPDEVKVAMVTAACLLAIAILFRNVIHRSVDMLVAIGPFYLFFVYLLTRGQAKKSGGGAIVAWNVVIVLVTFLIIIIYIIK